MLNWQKVITFTREKLFYEVSDQKSVSTKRKSDFVHSSELSLGRDCINWRVSGDGTSLGPRLTNRSSFQVTADLHKTQTCSSR